MFSNISKKYSKSVSRVTANSDLEWSSWKSFQTLFARPDGEVLIECEQDDNDYVIVLGQAGQNGDPKADRLVAVRVHAGQGWLIIDDV